MDIWEAKLHITKPRRSILLAKDCATKGEHTQHVAGATAKHLGIELKTQGDVGT